MNLSSILGPASLFIGTESETWSLADFQAAAQFAKILGVSLIIKVADGVFEWYRSIGDWEAVLTAVENEGVTAIPYMYCYGDKYGAISSEIAILQAILEYAGVVVADMEAEWSGHADWAATFANAFNAAPKGYLGVTTWADPAQQNWQGVIQALKPCVDFWMPQVYSDYLASMYQAQYAGLPIVPVFNLSSDFGPNDLLENVQAAPRGPVSFWEWQGARALSSAVIEQIVATQGGTPMLNITDPFAAAHFIVSDDQHWTCKNGIVVQDAILDYYRQTQGCMRLPRSPEIYGVIQGGSFQIFEAGVLVWDPQHSFDNPGQGPVYAMHLDEDTAGLRRLMALAGVVAPSLTANAVDNGITAVKAAMASLAVAMSDLEPVHP